MREFTMSRSHRSDLLARPPCLVRTYEDSVRASIVDPIEQIVELADLLSRGLRVARGVPAPQGQDHRPLVVPHLGGISVSRASGRDPCQLLPKIPPS